MKKMLAVSSEEFDDDRGYVKIFQFKKKTRTNGSNSDKRLRENILVMTQDGDCPCLKMAKPWLPIGAPPGNDDGGNYAGHTRIYKFNESEKI